MRSYGMRALWISIVLMASGCVTAAAHKTQMDELDKLRAADQASGAEQRKALETKIATLNANAAAAEAQHKNELASLNAGLLQVQGDLVKANKSLDDSQALIGELKKRLEKLGQNVDKLTGEKGQLAQALDEAKARLEELRRQKAAAEERAATFRSLVDKLKSMIDSGQLSVIVRNGKMLIVLSNDVLFDSGRTELKPAGKTALKTVATALAGIKDRHFVVAGHTDDVPIHTREFPSNWELSTARAVEVTRLFIESAVPATSLAAAGYGEFDPVVANDTPAHKAQNRRIEIELQPNLSELPSLENVLKPKS